MKAVIVVCGLLMLGGCATGGQSNPPWMAMGGSCTKLSGDQELSLNLADDMAKEGKLHASLANLQNLPSLLEPHVPMHDDYTPPSRLRFGHNGHRLAHLILV